MRNRLADRPIARIRGRSAECVPYHGTVGYSGQGLICLNSFVARPIVDGRGILKR